MRLGMCGLHYRRHKAGKPLAAPPRAVWAGAPCTIGDCNRKIVANGLCSMHWQRVQNGVPLDRLIQKPTGRPCEIDGCENRGRYRGWCPMHYQRWITHGDPHKVIVHEREHVVCTVDGCSNPTNTRDLCTNHRRRQLQGVPLDAPVRVFGLRQPCATSFCDRLATDFGLCRRCREREQYREYPEVKKARTARRRARARELNPGDRELSDAYRDAIRFDACRYCGDPDGAEVDHIFPLAKGGTDHWWNLTRACVSCNRRKYAHCGTHWHLKRGTWVVPLGSVPAVSEASPEHRRVSAPSHFNTFGSCEVGQNYCLFDLVPDYRGRGTA